MTFNLLFQVSVFVYLVVYLYADMGNSEDFQYTVCLNGHGNLFYYRNREDKIIHCMRPVATVEFKNRINTTGWSFLEVETSADVPLWKQGYAAGFAEARASRHVIAYHIQNMVSNYCKNTEKYCEQLYAFLERNYQWMLNKISDSEYWAQVNMTLNQVEGMIDGFDGQLNQNLPPNEIVRHPVYLLQLFGDLIDLEQKFGKPENTPVPKGKSHCSALVKTIYNSFGKLKDVYFSHVTWVSYASMLRVQKKYTFGNRGNRKAYSFSGYPGTVASIDDFVITSSEMAILETTIENHNKDLYVHTRPHSLLCYMRSQVAHRLAENGPEWAKIFSKHNSGTYNNQWVILDYKHFDEKHGHKMPLLYVLEQMPGKIVHGCQTKHLKRKQHWPSYNRAFYPEIFNMSGSPELVAKFGDWYSYENAPRAQIFARDFKMANTMEGMRRLMRSNSYMIDPIARCNCSPPYSAESVIAARSELNDPYGSYPIKDLGFMDQGATDFKVTNRHLVKSLSFHAISGPTYNPTPIFDWRTSILRETVPHHGHPDRWTFPLVKHQWRNTSFFKNYQ